MIAASIAPRTWAIERRDRSEKRHYKFASYRPNSSLVKVRRVSPNDGYYMHTYYDIVPWSPSQRYLAVTKLPFQSHDPVYGEAAEVCVIDLHEESIETLYTTKAWGYQLGANLNWGATDRYLYTNDVIDGQGVCVRLDLKTREVTAFGGPMTHLNPDESHVLGFPLDLINASQRGYGMPEVPGRQRSLAVGKPSEKQGIWRTDLRTNQSRLIASVADFHRAVPNPEMFDDRAFYLFFSKYNRQGTRCSEFLRGVHPNPGPGERRWMQMAFSHRPDGSDIVQAVTFGVHAPSNDWSNWHPDWEPGGHHIAWAPDGEHFTMNLVPDGRTMRFCHFRYDGTKFRVLSEKLVGGGHPTMERSGRYLIVDAYPNEPVSLPSGEVPIRLVDLHADEAASVCYIYTLGIGGSMRCDPHPCWSRDYTQVCFNGAPEGGRQVFIADVADAM